MVKRLCDLCYNLQRSRVCYSLRGGIRLELWQNTVESLIRGVRDNHWTPFDIVKAFYERTRILDQKIRAFIRVPNFSQVSIPDPDAVLPLPYAVKDNIMVKGYQTTCGSRLLWNYKAVYDATVIKRLKANGAVFFGKTNLDEFAMGSSTKYSAFFTTKNPWDLSRIPGGSSGGSAAAVAAGFVPFALGSDTGGSNRLPASHCGIVGYKPSYGLVSRYGLVAFGSSLDQIGPLCRSVRDAAYIGNILIGRDKKDATTVDYPTDLMARIENPIAGLRCAVIKQSVSEEIDPHIRFAFWEAVKVLRNNRCIVEEIDFPEERYAIAVYYILSPGEASSNLARFDGVRYGMRIPDASLMEMMTETRNYGFGEEVKRRILLGTFVLSDARYDAYYQKALKVRRLIAIKVQKIFKDYDVLLSPTALYPPFPIEENTDPLSFYLTDKNTVLANLVGLPALSMPMGFAKGMPCGLHLQCRPFSDSLLLNIARGYEKSAGLYEDEHYPFAQPEAR